MDPTFVVRVLKSNKLSGEEQRVLLATVALMEKENHGQLTQREIGAVTGMSQPAVSATLSSLVNNCFLTKENAPRGNLKVYGFGEKLAQYDPNRTQDDDDQ